MPGGLLVGSGGLSKEVRVQGLGFRDWGPGHLVSN